MSRNFIAVFAACVTLCVWAIALPGLAADFDPQAAGVDGALDGACVKIEPGGEWKMLKKLNKKTLKVFSAGAELLPDYEMEPIAGAEQILKPDNTKHYCFLCVVTLSPKQTDKEHLLPYGVVPYGECFATVKLHVDPKGKVEIADFSWIYLWINGGQD